MQSAATEVAAPPNSAPTNGASPAGPRPAPESGPSGGPTAAPKVASNPRPKGEDDGPNVLLAIAVALLIISLLATGYMVITVRGLNSKLADERAARSGVQDRITILEGTMNAVQSDETAIHGLLDAQAAADPAAIATRVQPSVYTVSTGDELGSAWVATSDGVTAKFVTNYHVIASAWERGVKTVQVFQDEGAQLTGTIEQALPDIDLALIDVTANIPALKQSSDTPRAGSAVVVIGSPLGLGGSVTTGAVSALREQNGINFIQFSAPISPGNSGGPLVNSAGEVIGITELKSVAFGAEGIALAIPVNQVCTRLQVC
jgi:S1-C subfamily serine protease